MQLENLIVELIKGKGPISFDEFMYMALYHPKLGYYMRKETKIGKEGDFFTASHVGKVFGVILCRAIERYAERLGFPKEFIITEMGPGMGYLAADILDELKKKENIYTYLKYNLVELNSELETIQRNRLKDHHLRTFWFNSIEKITPLEGVIICNEIFDALPVKIFEIRNRRLYEVYISIDKNSKLIETLMPPNDELLSYIELFAPHVIEIEGYRSEICLEGKTLIHRLSNILKKGFLLIIDYGYEMEEYYDPRRHRGTLLCYHKHQLFENPYINIGSQDITTHVNFTLLRKWAEGVGFTYESFQSQSQFLTSFCDESLLFRLKSEGLIDKFKRLVFPQGMGETHKVMVLSKHQ